MQLPDAAVGSIVAAAIAGLVVFVSTVLTKEQKTSEFRQTWIDELRKDISQFISGATEVTALYRSKAGKPDEQKKFIDDNFELIQGLQSVEHRIVLRLNPKEHAELIRQVSNFRGGLIAAYAGGNRKSEEERLTKELLDTTKSVLSEEWKRVKRGEPTFRIVKWIAVVAFGILGLWLVHAYFTYVPSPEKDKEKDTSKGAGSTQVFVDNHAQISNCVTHENLPGSHSSRKINKPKHPALAPQKCEPEK
ncbi:hypothetical protein [Burkholderia ubonensis]|uniref:hypothetical protein n=1 Tax=Burkholderia ubonensis TaxID=101571 RepID=UPI000A75025B|nr:hypothetical protein [Burkholderia ubonensis]